MPHIHLNKCNWYSYPNITCKTYTAINFDYYLINPYTLWYRNLTTTIFLTPLQRNNKKRIFSIAKMNPSTIRMPGNIPMQIHFGNFFENS